MKLMTSESIEVQIAVESRVNLASDGLHLAGRLGVGPDFDVSREEAPGVVVTEDLVPADLDLGEIRASRDARVDLEAGDGGQSRVDGLLDRVRGVSH